MTTQPIHLQASIPSDLCGERIDKVLAILFPQYSRQRLNTWLKSQQIKVDGKYLKSKEKVKGGELVEINTTLTDETTLLPEDIPLDILYEDDALMILNKPTGLVVHPGAGNHEHTLVNALLFYNKALTHLPRAGLIHRIDKDTTGLLLIAKRLDCYQQLVQLMQNKQIQRHYFALVNGRIITGDTIDKPIGRHPKHRTKMAINEKGKPAITHYRVMKHFERHTLLDVSLDTGRTHQIRVHMASLKHPLVGDKSYGARTIIPKEASQALIDCLQHFDRQALHAYRLVLPHPQTNETISIEAPMPQDLSLLIALLEDHDESDVTD